MKKKKNKSRNKKENLKGEKATLKLERQKEGKLKER